MKEATLLVLMLVIGQLSVFYSCKNTHQIKPNIIFILVDDLGWTDLGCYGSKFYETPNIDKLASDGILFTNAYAASPVCSPTRASIMTGKHPSRLNITDWIPGDDPKNRELIGPQDRNELPLEEITIAEVLRQNGYKTFFSGKWHLGKEGFHPEEQGFEINKGGFHMGHPASYYAPYKNPKLDDGPEGEYLTDRLTDETIRFIKENQNDPFFVFLSFYTVHTPIQANLDYVDYYKEKLESYNDTSVVQIPDKEGLTTINQLNPDYASMVHSMDANIGMILDKLEDLEIDDETIIIFTSDNGGLSTYHNRYNHAAPTSVKPLRAGKGWCYEGGIRVPLIIKNIAKDPISGQSNEVVVSYDFFPSIMDMAGVPIQEEIELDGISLTPLLKGSSGLSRDFVFWHYPHYHGSGWTPGAAIRSGKWKLIEFYESGKSELYNLESDIGEHDDLSEEYPEVVIELKRKLDKLQQEAGSMYPVKNSELNSVRH